MAARKVVFQHIGAGQPGAVGIVIHCAIHLVAGDLGRRVGAQVLHQVLHRVHTGFTFKGKAAQGVAEVAELLVQCLDSVQQRFTLLGIPGGCLADEQSCVDGVLVADMRAGQVAIALLKAEDIAVSAALGLQLADLLTDEFEAGQGAAQLDAVLFCNRRCHIGGNDGRYRHGVSRHRTLCKAGTADVVEDNTHLVTGDEPVAALTVGHGGAAAVTVRVGAQQQIGVDLVAQLQALLHSLADLGIRVRTGREVTIGLFLLGHNSHMGDAELLEQLVDTLKASAVQRGVDELERVNARAVTDTLVIDSLNKIVQTLVINHDYAAISQRLVIIDQPDAVKAVDLLNRCKDFFGSFQRDLAAVRAVDLVAVILGGVMAGGHADTRAAAEIPHRPRKRRGRLKAGVHIGCDAVGGQHTGRLAGKQLTVMAAVVGDVNLLRQVGCVQVVRQTLRCLADGIEIHAVGARTNNTAQTTGTEFQITIKTIGDGLVIPGHADKLRLNGIVQIRLGQPAVIQFLRVAHAFLLYMIHYRAATIRQSLCILIMDYFSTFCKYQIFAGTSPKSPGSANPSVQPSKTGCTINIHPSRPRPQHPRW